MNYEREDKTLIKIFTRLLKWQKNKTYQIDFMRTNMFVYVPHNFPLLTMIDKPTMEHKYSELNEVCITEGNCCHFNETIYVQEYGKIVDKQADILD